MLLIGAGLALGGAALFVHFSSRRGPAVAPAEPPPSGEETEPSATPAEEPPTAAEVLPVEPEPTSAPVEAPPSALASPPVPKPPPGGPSMADPPPIPQPDPRLFPIVTLLRDDTTGALALQIGPRTYRTAAELKESGDWTRVEFAARDLTRWLEGETQPERKTEPRRDEPSAAGSSMVEQINQILEGKLVNQPVSARAVRLAEGPGGTVRVYIGVQSYNLEEVPDPAIRAIIREAVTEWEARA